MFCVPFKVVFHQRLFVIFILPFTFKADGVVNENSTDLIVNYQLSGIRNLLRKVNGTIGNANIIQSQYPSPLTMSDPIPNIHGKEAEPIPLLKDAFYQTSTNLSFNVELKYPIETPYNLIAEALIKHKPVESSLPTPSSYFYKINKFCDTILDVSNLVYLGFFSKMLFI